MKQIITLISCFCIALAPSSALAAKCPASEKELMKESQHVITGKVLSVESKVQQSTIETGEGNMDEVYLVKVKVEFVPKGGDIKPGEEIVVRAWQPRKRDPISAIGLQGHETIPKVGERVTCYLLKLDQKDLAAGVYDPCLPNGITTKDIIEPKS